MQYESAARVKSVWTHCGREYLQLLTCHHPSAILLWIQQCIWSSVRTQYSTEHLQLAICQHAALILIWMQQFTCSKEHVLLVTCEDDVLILISVMSIKYEYEMFCVFLQQQLHLINVLAMCSVHPLSLRHMFIRNKKLCIPKFVLQKGNGQFCPSLLTAILCCLKSHVRSALW